MGIRLVGAAVLACALAPPSFAITFEDRVAAQKAIEQVYWTHRIWPKENPNPKPALSAVLPDAAIRARVEAYLRESVALEQLWQRPITSVQLQAELDRMTARSRDPEMLRELFAALGNDPVLIAETLARQTLADRLVRSWYAADDRFHGDLRTRAETARASCASPACMRSMGGRYVEVTSKAESDGRRIGDLGRLDETSDALAVSAVVAQSGDTVTIATVVWDKQPFDDWWRIFSRAIDPAVEAPAGSYSLSAPATGTCTDDTWLDTAHGLEVRQNHSAVWTGTEMIVWGGNGEGGSLNSGGRYNPSTDSWVATSRGAGCPSPRSSHTAVWTGTEMIIWGGGSGGVGSPPTGSNTGGGYEPATDSWKATSLDVGVPPPRRQHVAVWTGNEMIVWGGYNGSVQLNTGGRYNPLTGAWIPTPLAGAPSARYFHAAVWTGSEMIVWGGLATAQPLNTGGRFNPSTGAWQPTPVNASTPQGVYGHTAVWTGTRMIVWGGAAPAGMTVNTGGRYDPSTNSWLPTSTIIGGFPEARVGHTAVWTGARMIVWGGSGELGDLDTGWRYDPATDTWASTSTHQGNPFARSQHTAVWTGSEMIVWGGRADGGAVFVSGGRYAPSTDSWVSTALPLSGEPAARTSHTAVWTGTEMIVWGGIFSNSRALSSGGRYMPATDSWLPTAGGGGAPSRRSDHTAVWSGTEMIVWGGADDTVITDTGARYDPASDQWQATSRTGAAPTPRIAHVAVWTGTEMIVWGGSDGIVLNTGGRYHPGTDSWTATPTTGAPSPRRGATGVWTGAELLVWGGIASGGPPTSGGRYSPTGNSWQPISEGANVPAGRDLHSAVWTGSEMIVWGGSVYPPGQQYHPTNTGGRYAPGADSWVPTSLAGDPPDPRVGQSAVWTGTEMIVWGGGPLTATGRRYDPSRDTWLATSMVGSPLPRSEHTAVWTGSEMIVWGGANGGAESGPFVLASGGRYCAAGCASPATLYRDVDGDGYGDPNVTHLSCSTPAGWLAIAGDCNDTNGGVHPGVPEICNQLDDDCDTLFDENALGEDTDGDGVHNLCDGCVTAFDPAQSDSDQDGVGDLCDLSDGLIYVFGADRTHISWQAESGPTSWNVYEGDLGVLRTSGIYTQAPGSNPLANRRCGVPGLVVDDTAPVPGGAVKFSLVTGVTSGIEGGLGTNSHGFTRPNTNPCP